MRAFKIEPNEQDYKTYLDHYPEMLKIIQDLITEQAEKSLDQYGWGVEPTIDELECRSRDGFIANSYNHGGIDATAIVPFSAGMSYASKEANKNIESMAVYNYECALESLKFTKKQKLTDAQLEQVYDAEQSYSDEDTIMEQIRIMYHGDENGVHSMSISACVNWESPYHRSSGAVYRDMGCQGKPMRTEVAKEVEIEFKTPKQLKTRLTRALKQVCNEIL